MKIETYKIGRALEVVKLLKEMSNIPNVEGYIDSFDNCREQGFKLAIHGYKELINLELTFLFSENRNSDDMVVYWQPKRFERAFSENGKCMTETMWNNRQYLNSERKTANFIHDTILEQIKKCKKAKDE